MNAREYRDYMHKMKSHPPESLPNDFKDKRNSLSAVYGSLIPFVVLEYWTEANTGAPAGLLFPTGFLLYWAFYYTYYQPGFLEERLTSPQKWDAMSVSGVLLGVCIWFVKVTFVELTGLLFKRKAKPKTQPPKLRIVYSAPRTQNGGQTPPPPNKPVLPADLVEALKTLGLPAMADWKQIHHRYRELAKQYHPDLNQDITDIGRRFMRYDAAYRKLAANKHKFFAA